MDIKELYKLYLQHPCITTDSRDCPKDSIFLALKGESFNGNQFAVQALEKGCAYAIVDEAPTNSQLSTLNSYWLTTAYKPIRTWHGSIADNSISLSSASQVPMARRRQKN